jgi:hypothetical protein
MQLTNEVAWEVRLPYVNSDFSLSLSLHLSLCRQTQRIVGTGDQQGLYIIVIISTTQTVGLHLVTHLRTMPFLKDSVRITVTCMVRRSSKAE